MKLPVTIAKKLLQLMQGERLPASLLQHRIVNTMIEDGALQKVQKQRTATVFISDAFAFQSYLRNNFQVADLQLYVTALENEELNRSESIVASGNSKLRSVRTFKGFVVNAYEPVPATLNGKKITIQPGQGTCTFIHQYELFLPAEDVTIVGEENAENFFSIIFYRVHIQ